MGNWGIKIDLGALSGAVIREVDAGEGPVRCLCVPIDGNPEVYEGERGVYLSMTAFETDSPSPLGNTHLVKANVPAEVYAAMTTSERRAMPVIGRMMPVGWRARRRRGEGPEEARPPRRRARRAEGDDDLPY